MSPRGQEIWALALASLFGTLAGCDGDKTPEIHLLAFAEWNDDPGSAADFGYRVRADISWVDHIGKCVRMSPGLRVTVNEREAERIGYEGDCVVDVLFEARAFVDDQPVTIRLFDGDRRLGEATFEGTFWGFQSVLLVPRDGQVGPGDEVVASIPSGRLPPTLLFARFYWLETAPSVPPFHTSAEVVLGPDNATISARVPELTGTAGRAAAIFTFGGEDHVSSSACTGFTDCAMYARPMLGPFFLDLQ